jgi:hypothetical protein
MATHSKSSVAICSLIRAKACYLEGDWISSTILAGAAQRILKDLCVAAGIESTIDTVSASLGRKPYEVHNLITTSYNGMKHADRDPEGTIDVSSKEPQALIVMAAADLVRLKIPYSSTVGEILNFAKSFSVEQQP